MGTRNPFRNINVANTHLITIQTDQITEDIRPGIPISWTQPCIPVEIQMEITIKIRLLSAFTAYN